MKYDTVLLKGVLDSRHVLLWLDLISLPFNLFI